MNRYIPNYSDYGIYVIEQSGNDSFNRAMLSNVGAIESLKQYDYECFIFHDVDLLPQYANYNYECTEKFARHLSAFVDYRNYTLPYPEYFGGVAALSLKQFQAINGFSNDYWGWGKEDDDMYKRLTFRIY